MPLVRNSGETTRVVTIHIPFDSIRFRLLPFDFEYFDSIIQTFQTATPLIGFKTEKPLTFYQATQNGVRTMVYKLLSS